jgi:hypothetical protein
VNDVEKRTRSYAWLYGLFALAVVAAMTLFVIDRVRLTTEERMFLGTWQMQFDGMDLGMVTFRRDRTGRGDTTFTWAVHGARAVFWADDNRSEVRKLWDRMAGLDSTGVSTNVELLTSERIVISNSGHLHVFTR